MVLQGSDLSVGSALGHQILATGFSRLEEYSELIVTGWVETTPQWLYTLSSHAG